ncbi:hypothetical protein G4B88_017783 [Cannabis sativa]|uniref:Uncharacterized protein n=2 Tax=Cannabis sativa TaxID=3483 RepID=A0A7J6DYQ5_CANSA|nr:hypothetical protein G4B88_017783 [Cannabis sativa]
MGRPLIYELFEKPATSCIIELCSAIWFYIQKKNIGYSHVGLSYENAIEGHHWRIITLAFLHICILHLFRVSVKSFAMASKVLLDDMEPWLDLQGKVVMVTGASSGLSRDFCVDLAIVGCRVVAAARRVDRLKSLSDEIKSLALSTSSSSSSSVRAMAVELDVCVDGPTIEKSVQRAWEAFGRINALVNNADIKGYC